MRVLISGAGIAGSTAAFFLAKAGFQVTVIEKASSLLAHGQNVDIQKSARTVIKKMGLAPAVRAAYTNEAGTRLVYSNDKPCASFPVVKDRAASGTSEWEILRGDLAKILYDAAKSYPNVSYIFGTTIDRVISNTTESITVSLSSGEQLTSDILIASDGQWSRIRKQTFPESSTKIVDTGMYAIYYTIPRTSLDNDWWNIYIAPSSRIITTRPDPHGTIRALFSIMPITPTQKASWSSASRADRKSQQSLLRSEFANAGWQASRVLAALDSIEAEDFYFHPIRQVKMSKWSHNRIICLGDTAYCPSPLTGMGTSLALEGAYVLAGELSTLQNSDHPSKAFESYESLFRPFVEESQQIPWILPGPVHPQYAWQRWIFHNMMWGVSKIVSLSWVQNWLGDDDGEDFKLPVYAAFEGLGSENGKQEKAEKN